MRCPWCWTSEEANTDIFLWRLQARIKRHRRVSRLCRRTTREITRQPWETSARNWEVLAKSSDVQKVHCRGRSLKKANHHGGGTSIPFPTGGPDDRIWTGVYTHHDATPLLNLREDIKNQPRRKCRKDDGDLQPRGTPCQINWKIGKGERICARRRADDCWYHDGVQGDHNFGTYEDVKRGHKRVNMSNHRP